VTTSEPAILLRGVSRKFTLRGNSRRHLLPLLGFGKFGGEANEFWALRDIDLTLAPGIRLGIVGRNGAGKSTLLKIISGLLRPSEGHVTVRGKIETLMHLGTGFHPEFTGQQNVLNALAYKGVTGRRAERLADEIIEFAELEEFADNPLKTYSSGMTARLGFAAATVMAPEVLIIDEVLGAGDAYFASKSFDRMRQLTQNGATVLFVSHDMAAIENLCSEALWLERGRIRQCDTTAVIAKGYAKQIREQERLRLRARNSRLSAHNFRQLRSRQDRPLQLIVRIVAREAVVAAAHCALLFNGEAIAEVDIGGPQDIAVTEDAAVLIDTNIGHWGPPRKNRETRFHRDLPARSEASGAVYFNLSMMEAEPNWGLRWLLRGAPCEIEVFNGREYVAIGKSSGSDTFASLEYDVPSSVVADFLRSEGLQSLLETSTTNARSHLHQPPHRELDADSGHLCLDELRFENRAGDECHIFRSFEQMKVRWRYRAIRDVHDAVFVVCFYREGVCALQSMSDLILGGATTILAGVTGEAIFTIPELSLGRGIYLVSVAVFPSSVHLDRSGDHGAYLLLDRRFQIRVEQPEGGLIDLGMSRAHTEWSIANVGTDKSGVQVGPGLSSSAKERD